MAIRQMPVSKTLFSMGIYGHVLAKNWLLAIDKNAELCYSCAKSNEGEPGVLAVVAGMRGEPEEARKMAKKSSAEKSGIVRGAGFAAALWIAFEAAVREAGGSEEDIHRLATEDGAETLRKMARVAVLRGECEILTPEKPAPESQPTPVPTTYRVTVDYGMSLWQMIAAGRYGLRNNEITAERFPFQGTGRVELELHLVHLGQDASADTVLAEMERRNLRPAKIEELLALGAKYPNLQKEFPIVAFGSVWKDPERDRYVAYLNHCGGSRFPILSYIGINWLGGCRFLAVSK